MLDELYNKIGQKGFRAKVTEFSALKLTEDLKADLLIDTMIVSFANENVDSFYMCGFSGIYYFYKVFKCETGATPAEYKKNIGCQ